MKEHKLNDCPFCGSHKVKLITGKDERGFSQFDRVTCAECGGTGAYYDGHPEDAVAAWNAAGTRLSPEYLEITLPNGFMNVGVTSDNHLVADTNDSANWDTLKFPLPPTWTGGPWKIYSEKEKIVTLVQQ